MMASAHDRLRLRAYLGIVLYGGSLLLIGLGSARVLTYHEMVFAEPAREMLAGGEWAVSRIAGVAFADKPPGTAWAIAASMLLTGSQSEWAVRLPSVVAAILTGLVIALLAGRWFGPRVGLVAALMHLTSVSTLMQGRLAEADMPLCLLVAAALTVFALAVVEAPPQDQMGASLARRLLPSVFYLAVGLAFLVKTAIGPVLVFAACGAWVLVERDRRAVRFLLDPLGLLVGAACVVPWLASLWRQCPEAIDVLLRHNVGRFRGVFAAREPWYAYLYLVPLVLLPWTPWVLLGAWRGVRSGLVHDPRWRFLACWFAPGMLVLSLSAFRSKHYPIPLLPPLMIVAAAAWCELAARRFKQPPVHHRGAMWAAAAGAAAALAAVWCFDRRHPVELSAIIGLIAAGVLAVLACERRRWRGAALAATFGTAWAAAVAVQLFVMPRHDSYRAQTELAARVNAAVPAGEPVYLVRLPNNQVTYYLRNPLVRLDAEAAFPDWPALTAPGGVYVLAPAHAAGWLSLRGEVELLDRSAYLHHYLAEADRLVFFRWRPGAGQAEVGQTFQADQARVQRPPRL